jgi:L-alanine-DL-glutamate epimerase-like enolase superfamily enzyme
MHFKAAAGGDGYVEVDANPNPLREVLGAPYPRVDAGSVKLSDRPGLGVAPDMDVASEFLKRHDYR